MNRTREMVIRSRICSPRAEIYGPEGNPGMQPLFAPSGSVILGMQPYAIQVTVHLEWYRGNCSHSSRLLLKRRELFLRLAMGA
ncbi:hypothetical protein GCM10008014_34110 [Paenibacillus silvae]|uniref:Uncharacterized protein n=1 Tax=Paenibacillus silvae TaxID=1325358 RepID=A0ABQ1ZFT8_9BACL|nr:hypothetical protein GCM10008014_34110 [Paenibacillus silvae]